ncbi:hypothetical protein HK104_006014, partial [Borealophlyctis nickersoniae]
MTTRNPPPAPDRANRPKRPKKAFATRSKPPAAPNPPARPVIAINPPPPPSPPDHRGGAGDWAYRCTERISTPALDEVATEMQRLRDTLSKDAQAQGKEPSSSNTKPSKPKASRRTTSPRHVRTNPDPRPTPVPPPPLPRNVWAHPAPTSLADSLHLQKQALLLRIEEDRLRKLQKREMRATRAKGKRALEEVGMRKEVLEGLLKGFVGRQKGRVWKGGKKKAVVGGEEEEEGCVPPAAQEEEGGGREVIVRTLASSPSRLHATRMNVLDDPPENEDEDGVGGGRNDDPWTN